MEGDHEKKNGVEDVKISIHSLRMEGDLSPAPIIRQFVISIHSLRMEGDSVRTPNPAADLYFNPLPPHGGRQ